jgi:hypothetical protein
MTDPTSIQIVRKTARGSTQRHRRKGLGRRRTRVRQSQRISMAARAVARGEKTQEQMMGTTPE